MKKYIKNIVVCLVCFLFIILLNFALPRLISGDPVAYLTGMDEGSMSVEQYEFYRNALHIDENAFVQFGYYLKDIFAGRLGYSFRKQASVAELIGTRIGATLQISFAAVVISCALALVWGLTSGSKKGLLDKVSTPVNVLVGTFPTFLIGMILIIVFSFDFKIFPYSGLNSPDAEGGAAYFFDRIYHLILPVVTLIAVMLPSRFLLMRNTVRTAMGERYVLFARQRGLNMHRIRYSYLLKNVAPPFATMVGMSVGASIGGSVIVENLFSINGMGTLLTDAVYALDYPLLQGVLFVSAAIAMVSIVLTDIICIIIDPKARSEGVK